MIAAVVLILIGFVVIFATLKKWSEVRVHFWNYVNKIYLEQACYC